MAQPAHRTHSDFGLQYCLLFLLATQRAGASTFQEFQNPGESPTSDNLSPTPNLIYTTPSDHTALHLGQSPPEHPKSPETHQSKHHCNATHHFRPIHKPIRNSKNFTIHHKAAPTSGQNPSNQGKDPIIQNGRSADSSNIHKILSDATYPTTKPKSKTTCLKYKICTPTVKRNAFKTVTPLESTIITLDSKSTTTLSHHSIKSEGSNRPTFSSEKSTAYNESYKTRTTENKKKVDDHTAPANYHTAVASDKTLINTREQTKETPRATEKNKQTPVKPTYHGQKTISVHVNTTRALATPTEHRQQKTSAHEKITREPEIPTKYGQQSTLVHEITRTPGLPTEQGQQSTLVHEITRAPALSTEQGEQSTLVHEITRALALSTEQGQQSTLVHEITRTPGLPTEQGQQSTLVHEMTRTPAMSTEQGQQSTLVHEITRAPALSTELGQQSTLVHEITRAPAMSTEQGQQSTLVHEITTATAMPIEHRQQSTMVHKITRGSSETTEYHLKTTVATEQSRGASGKPIVHTKKKTSNKGKTTAIPAKPTESPASNTAGTETIRSPTKVTGDQSITTSSPHPKRTENTPQLPIGSITLSTFSMELSSVMSEAPANKSHSHQNKDSSQGGLHVEEVGKDDSFPPWAIVIVVLVAVILLLMFLGLIFLISHMMWTQRALIHNTENNDPEDDRGPNSYQVYLMEQQTLGVGQIPSPR
ncbi:mucin-like protein 3 [Sturnira hondurensis]|uniref:mucin-like protein 3 n=1 Tax=Sturnira hondurensis TaxID=192404 RepID=UPI001879EDC6|nr:mucin-like protein 3 [Sturnira hondurensis]